MSYDDAPRIIVTKTDKRSVPTGLVLTREGFTIY